MKFLPDTVASKVARPMLKLRKVSPQLMFGAGVVGVVGAGVLACRATLQLDEVLQKAEKRAELLELENLHNADTDGVDHARLIMASKIKTVMSIAKLYAPAVGVAVVSIGLLTGSHVTLTRRNAATMAAYSALNEAYNRYRGHVVDAYGADEDEKFHNGFSVVEETVVDENGKSKKIKRAAAAGLSPYAALFTEGNENWNPQAHTNWFFLNSQERYWNDRLQTYGHVFLNEVYDSLGLPRTQQGAVVGWIVGEHERDGYISFGMNDEKNERVRAFMAGVEGSIWLDFNVDGVVYDKI